MRTADPFDRADDVRKKKGRAVGTPPDLCAVSRLKRLLQGVDAGAEVDVKCRAVHY